MLATTVDARFDFDRAPHSAIADTQIRVLGDLRFWEVEPGSGDTKNVLLGSENKVFFEKINQSFTLNEADLLLLVPNKDFLFKTFCCERRYPPQSAWHGPRGEIRCRRQCAGDTNAVAFRPRGQYKTFSFSGRYQRLLENRHIVRKKVVSDCTFTPAGCSPSSLYAFPEFPGLGSVLPYRSRDVGFTDFDE
jgi:hypothetical protein